MAVSSMVLRMIVDNSRMIIAILRCVGVVARNIIIILVIFVATIFLVIIRYDIVSSVVVIILIGITMVEIMVMVMNIFLGDHRPCCLTCLGR